MSSKPPPSVMCSLLELPSRTIGDKVRFLGCVSAYSVSATLTLEQGFPKPARVKAEVDVTLQLENLKAENVQVGQWINVMGIVTSISHAGESGGSREDSPSLVAIQALLLWPVHSLDIHCHDKELDRMRSVYGKLDQMSGPPA